MAGQFALDSVRVIDFGQYIAGPLAAMLLGDQGADVIRVDPPGGPRFDTPANATWNRNKRSIVLDLKNSRDLETARRLIASADVVIENFRPGVMDRLGLGARNMTAAHPRLIYASMPGFGADDPRSGIRAWEGVLGAATASYRAGTHDRPVYTAIPFSSLAAAFLSAVSIAGALNARERSGLGQRIDIPLYDATFTLFSNMFIKAQKPDNEPKAFVWARQLPTKDGRWVRYIDGNKGFEAFVHGIGLAQHRDAGVNFEELNRRYEEVFRTRTAAEWETYCADLGTECATCNSSAEWLRHPQALASGIVSDFDDPILGRFRGPGINVRMSATPGEVRRPRPAPDAHRNELLRELSAQAAAPAPQVAAKEPAQRSALQGVRVLDLCIILAGPTCGRTLAELGADVIKIDPPDRNPVNSHLDINRGKRSIVLDLKHPEGLSIFWKLVDTADVVLQNLRKGVADQLGVGYEAVKARRPDIVYCSMNTFGQLGPYAGRPGHESIAQAISGMMVRFGDTKPANAPFVANDYCTGLMGAYAVLLALLHRQRTGQGQHVDTALAYTATMLQSSLIQDYAGKQWNEPCGQGALGSGALNRLYKASDGWLFMSARAGDLKHCAKLADLAALADNAGNEVEMELEQRFQADSVEVWEAALAQAGIGAHRVLQDPAALKDDPLAIAKGLSITREHEGLGLISTSGPGPKLSRTPLTEGKPASRPGADAASVLSELGLENELDRLIAERVVVVEGIAAG